MDDSTGVPEKGQPKEDPIATIGLDLENLTVGALRWLVSVVDGAGLDDDAPVFTRYNEQWTDVVEGIEIYISSSALRNAAKRK